MNDKPVQQSAAVQLAQNKIDGTNEVEASLTINDVTLDDSATVVKAIAKNVAGKVDTSARLDVKSNQKNRWLNYYRIS